MFSVKTTDQKGNLQLTLGPGTAPDGTNVLVLDADIDENGETLAHALDVFKHKATKQGTHPIDIHECLCLARIAPLGYTVA
jgi:hypoxanthine phosphoribosyltransferase